MNNKIYSMIGIACKAGKIVSGEDKLRFDIKKNNISLLLIAEDASENTKKRFINSADFYNVRYLVYGSKELLGKHIGKLNRAVIGITDNNFSDTIYSLINEELK